MEDIRNVADAVCEALDSKKGKNILILDVKDMTSVTDYMITATGTTKSQLKAMCDEVDEKIKEKFNLQPIRVEGYTEGRWIAMDYGTVLVHIFCDEYRDLYQLEQLWSNGNNVTKYVGKKDEQE